MLYGFKCSIQFVRTPDELHADTTATRSALQHNWVTNLCRLRMCLSGIGEQACAGQQWHAAFLCELTCCVLQAKIAHLLWCRADKGNTCRFASLGKVGIFR